MPTRAGEALIGPVGAITATSLALVPGQPAALLGAEIVAVGLVMVIAPSVFQIRGRRTRRDITPQEWIVRPLASAGVSLAFPIGGALLFGGARAGPIGSPPATSSASSRSLSASVLMVEILR